MHTILRSFPTRARCLLPVLLILLSIAVQAKTPLVLKAFQQREKFSKREMPLIIRAAEAVAERIIANPKALINVPYSEQPSSFSEEVLNRAGGLANPLPSVERPKMCTPQDVVLFSARSWEKDGAQTAKYLQEYHKNGWLIVLFASKQGMPKDIPVDYLIDNGASGPGDDEAVMNALANMLNSWLWTCEYTAALTRHGKSPAILASMVLPMATAHNAHAQSPEGRLELADCTTAIPAGQLAGSYLKRVDALCKTLAGKKIQGQLRTATDAMAAQLAAGGKVHVATCEHFLMAEIFLNNKSPMHPFNVVWRAATAFPQNVSADDIVLWFSYIGMSTSLEDYGKCLRATKARFIPCYVPDANAANNAPDALCVIEQSWVVGDAEVSIPFAPGKMAPVSGINQGLLYRMLDDAVAAKLAAKKTK